MNIASGLLGIILIPVLGILWELGVGIPLSLLGMGTFNLITWTATFFIAVGSNALIETYALKYAHKMPFGRSRFLWLCLANGVSVGIALISYHLYPPYP